MSQVETIDNVEGTKTPIVAVILSFIFVGLGQMYAGKIGRGVFLIILFFIFLATSASIITAVLAFILWIWGMVDAAECVRKHNNWLLNIASDKKENEQKQRSKEINSNEFVGFIKKNFELHKNGLLNDDEFNSKKAEALTLLSEKEFVDKAEDLLTAMIPLVKENAITDQEVKKIKELVY